MTKKLLNITALIIFAAILTGCVGRTEPVYNAVSVPVPEKLRFAPDSDIEAAIIKGGSQEGWKMKAVSPGKVKATLDIRTHQAVVDIDYTNSAYSITYADSNSLLYSKAGIHKNYNIWVRQLEASINNSLQGVSQSRTKQQAPDIQSAEDAWRAIENSKDPKQYLLFLENYGESAYAPAAVRRLSELVEKGNFKSLSDPFGDWRVNVTYNAIRGSSSWCVKKRSWQFVQNISSTPIRRTVWHRETALYFDSNYVDSTVQLNILVPDGGSKWKWDTPLILDEERKVFNAESVTGGGSYSNCLGKLNVIMTKES